MLRIDGNIGLRRPEPKDVEAMYQYRNDPEIVSALGVFSKGFARNDLTEWIEFHRKNAEDLVWSIADSEDNCIGHCGLYKINSRTGVALLGICIGQHAFRGKGIGKAVIGSVLDYAFEQMNLRKIRAEVMATNRVALHLLEKIGFNSEGILREAKYRNGQYIDFHMLGVFRSEWKQENKK